MGFLYEFEIPWNDVYCWVEWNYHWSENMPISDNQYHSYWWPTFKEQDASAIFTACGQGWSTHWYLCLSVAKNYWNNVLLNSSQVIFTKLCWLILFTFFSHRHRLDTFYYFFSLVWLFDFQLSNLDIWGINGALTFLVYYFFFLFLRLIITCRLWVIYVREDNYSNV